MLIIYMFITQLAFTQSYSKYFRQANQDAIDSPSQSGAMC